MIKYHTIVCDPPWDQDIHIDNGNRAITKPRDAVKIRGQRNNRKSAYTTMPTEQIKDIQYRTVVVDPPWDQDVKEDITYGRNKRGRETHTIRTTPYTTMPTDDIKQIIIPRAENCHLFLWTTQTMLHTAFDVLDAWGAKYACTITWAKHRGISTWRIHRNTEFLLYAYWGSRKETLPLKTIPCILDVPATGKHSEKPAKIYQKIVQWTPAPRLDMFARRRHIGFDTWGDQVEQLPHEQQTL